jgi:hypothetical protein
MWKFWLHIPWLQQPLNLKEWTYTCQVSWTQPQSYSLQKDCAPSLRLQIRRIWSPKWLLHSK